MSVRLPEGIVMATTSQVSERGQITIDKSIRKRLGVKPGMIAYQRLVDDHLEVFFLPGPHRESLFGALHQEEAPPGPMTGEELEQAVMEAVAEKWQRIKEYGG